MKQFAHNWYLPCFTQCIETCSHISFIQNNIHRKQRANIIVKLRNHHTKFHVRAHSENTGNPKLEMSHLSHSWAAARFHISSMTYWTFSTFVILAAMVHCIILGYTNSSMKGCSFKGSFYLVPSKKMNLRNPWLSRVSCADLSTWDPCKWHIWSNHFKVSDFRRIAMVAEDVGYYRWQLKLDAVSTVRMQGPVKQPERQKPWMAAVKLAKHRYKLNRSMSCRITAQNFQLTGAFLNIHHIW